MTLLFGLLAGVVMGWLIQRVRASDPAMIKANLRLENLSIIKFMALAIAAGTVGVHLLGLWLPLHLAIKPTYVLGVLAGGLIFGVGFALAGFCPGTCVVGAAEGRKDAMATIAGGLVGALVFTMAYPLLEGPFIRSWNYGQITLATALNAPAWLVALALAAVLLIIIRLLPTERRQAS